MSYSSADGDFRSSQPKRVNWPIILPLSQY